MRTLIAMVAATALALAACTQPPNVVVEPADVAVQSPDVVVESAERPTGISVSGQGVIAGVPDTLTVNIGVSLMRDTVGEAVADAAEVTDGVISALLGQGVAKEDIRTAEFSIFPEFAFFFEEEQGRERQELIGYRVENRLSVKIRELERAGEIIDSATAAGGDETIVSGVFFSLEDNQELLEEARAEAWSDAEAKANQLAVLAGVELGEVSAVREFLQTFPPDFGFGGLQSFAAAEFATPIQPGQLDVSVVLEVEFGIGG